MKDIEKYLKDLIIGKIPVKLDLHEPDPMESGESFHENEIIELPDDCTISCKFIWEYTREKGMKGDGRLTPDDPDKITLDYLDIEECYFYISEVTPIDIKRNPTLKKLMIEFLIGELPVDDVDRSVYKTNEKRMMKFEEFVNERKSITAEQMVKSFVANVDAGWILKDILINKKSIEEQLIEHFDVAYGFDEPSIQDAYPIEFKNAVNQLMKIYLKK